MRSCALQLVYGGAAGGERKRQNYRWDKHASRTDLASGSRTLPDTPADTHIPHLSLSFLQGKKMADAVSQVVEGETEDDLLTKVFYEPGYFLCIPPKFGATYSTHLWNRG